MRHVIHNVITFYEMEAQATCAVLSEVQKSLTAFDKGWNSGEDQERSTQAGANSGLQMAEPTWAQRVDRQIEETEAHLQQQLCEYDRILEGLTGAQRMSASA